MSTPIKWISVKDRLPEPGLRVLTWNHKGWRRYKLGIHNYERDYSATKCDWWIGDQNHRVDDGYVTHWAELPPGPGGEHVEQTSYLVG